MPSPPYGFTATGFTCSKSTLFKVRLPVIKQCHEIFKAAMECGEEASCIIDKPLEFFKRKKMVNKKNRSNLRRPKLHQMCYTYHIFLSGKLFDKASKSLTIGQEFTLPAANDVLLLLLLYKFLG